MGRNSSNTQEEWRLTWSVQATEGTGTCGGRNQAQQTDQGSVGRRQRQKKEHKGHWETCCVSEWSCVQLDASGIHPSAWTDS